MCSFRLTSSFSNLAFRLLCTSRLPSFFAYQIEANITTGETTCSGLQSQLKWLKLLSICTECSLSADCSIEAGAEKKKKRGREQRQDDAEGRRESAQQSQVYISRKRTRREELKRDRQTGRTGRTDQLFPLGILSILKFAKHLSAAAC